MPSSYGRLQNSQLMHELAGGIVDDSCLTLRLAFLGVFTNSVGGAIDFGAGIITGVRRSIFGEEAPRRVSEPLASEIDVTYLVYYRQGLIAIYPDRVTTGQDTFPLNQLILVECDDAIFRAYSDQAQPIIILVCARPEQARDIRDLIRVLHTHDVLRQLSHATSQ